MNANSWCRSALAAAEPMRTITKERTGAFFWRRTGVGELEAAFDGFWAACRAWTCKKVAARPIGESSAAVTALGTAFYAGHSMVSILRSIVSGWKAGGAPLARGQPLHSLHQARLSTVRQRNCLDCRGPLQRVGGGPGVTAVPRRLPRSSLTTRSGVGNHAARP